MRQALPYAAREITIREDKFGRLDNGINATSGKVCWGNVLIGMVRL
jgi:hypothetical protein